MTDDSSIPNAPLAPPPIQRLDGLTAEWTVADLPWLTPEETPETDTVLPGDGARPTPPSQRRGPLTAFTGGAAAPFGATGTRAPLITRPKPRQPELAIPRSVLVATDLGATLPPRAEREAAAAPAVERNVLAPRPRGLRLPFVAFGTAIGCFLGYALWIAVVRPAAAQGAPERQIPQFLKESPPSVVAPAGAGIAAAQPASSALPPALEGTLAQALPPSTSEAAAAAGDAGAAAAQPSLAEGTSPPASPPSAETLRRAEALRTALLAQRTESTREPSGAKPETKLPTVAHRAQKPKQRLGTTSSSDAAAVRKGPPTDPPASSDAPTLRREPSAALRPLTTYIYEDKALFSVATAPLRVTDLTLESGETLVSQPTAGDAARWVISVVQGGERSHVFVKPLRPGLRTNLTLTTNRRSYFLELSCRDDGTYMAGVAWQYPADENARRREALAQAERERQSTTAVADLQALRFDYRIEGSPSWRPTMVFDDGKKTFIRFPRPVSPDQAPALFLLRSGSARDATYVNYRIKGDLYVVDRLLESGELRLADDDVVRITRKH